MQKPEIKMDSHMPQKLQELPFSKGSTLTMSATVEQASCHASSSLVRCSKRLLVCTLPLALSQRSQTNWHHSSSCTVCTRGAPKSAKGKMASGKVASSESRVGSTTSQGLSQVPNSTINRGITSVCQVPLPQDTTNGSASRTTNSHQQEPPNDLPPTNLSCKVLSKKRASSTLRQNIPCTFPNKPKNTKPEKHKHKQPNSTTVQGHPPFSKNCLQMTKSLRQHKPS